MLTSSTHCTLNNDPNGPISPHRRPKVTITIPDDPMLFENNIPMIPHNNDQKSLSLHIPQFKTNLEREKKQQNQHAHGLPIHEATTTTTTMTTMTTVLSGMTTTASSSSSSVGPTIPSSVAISSSSSSSLSSSALTSTMTTASIVSSISSTSLSLSSSSIPSLFIPSANSLLKSKSKSNSPQTFVFTQRSEKHAGNLSRSSPNINDEKKMHNYGMNRAVQVPINKKYMDMDNNAVVVHHPFSPEETSIQQEQQSKQSELKLTNVYRQPTLTQNQLQKNMQWIQIQRLTQHNIPQWIERLSNNKELVSTTKLNRNYGKLMACREIIIDPTHRLHTQWEKIIEAPYQHHSRGNRVRFYLTLSVAIFCCCAAFFAAGMTYGRSFSY